MPTEQQLGPLLRRADVIVGSAARQRLIFVVRRRPIAEIQKPQLAPESDRKLFVCTRTHTDAEVTSPKKQRTIFLVC